MPWYVCEATDLKTAIAVTARIPIARLGGTSRFDRWSTANAWAGWDLFG